MNVCWQKGGTPGTCRDRGTGRLHVSPECGRSGVFSTVLLITVSFPSADFFGANALRVQTVIPGAYVHEHRAANDECLVLWGSTARPCKCQCVLSAIVVLKKMAGCTTFVIRILFVLFKALHAFCK